MIKKLISDYIINFMGIFGTLLLEVIKNKTIKTCELIKEGAKTIKDGIYHNNINKDWDGKFLPDCNKCSEPCKADSIGGLKKEPKEGKLPNFICSKKPLPKIYFINGINNTPQENCEATKAIANAACSEVIGVYNRTQGITTDLLECLGNIFNSHPFGGDKPTQTIKDLILNSIKGNPPQNITVYAHSQGGLVSREALGEVKKALKGESYNMTERQINKRMEKVNIKSFGTAENNWPAGPNYEQFTHPKDMVPKVIAKADILKDAMFKPSPMNGDIINYNYDKEIKEYNAKFAVISKEQRHKVETMDKDGIEFGLGPLPLPGIAAHNMINSYEPAIKKHRKKEDKCDECKI